MIAYANSLDPDQDRQNFPSDLNLNNLTLIMFLKDFFEKKKSTDNNKSMKNDLSKQTLFKLDIILIKGLFHGMGN